MTDFDIQFCTPSHGWMRLQVVADDQQWNRVSDLPCDSVRGLISSSLNTIWLSDGRKRTVNIVERAIPYWAESSVVYYYPILVPPDKWPEGLKLARRISTDYGVHLKRQLVELLQSSSAEVACQALAVLTWGRMIDPCEIPASIKESQREVTIAACFLARYTVSEFAKICEGDLLQSKIPDTFPPSGTQV